MVPSLFTAVTIYTFYVPGLQPLEVDGSCLWVGGILSAMGWMGKTFCINFLPIRRNGLFVGAGTPPKGSNLLSPFEEGRFVDDIAYQRFPSPCLVAGYYNLPLS